MSASAYTTETQAPGRSLEDLTRTVSASRLSLWSQCRLKFWFRYVEQIVKPVTAALHVGSTVHGVLRAWNVARWRKEAIGTDGLKECFQKLWEEPQKLLPVDWKGEEEAQRATAWSLLETYFRESPIPPNERPEAVEVGVETDLSKHGLPSLVGFIDLVRAGGRIVDFKTSAQTPNPEKVAHLHETQCSCYAVLYREATGKREGGIELHHLVKLKTPKLVVTPLGPMTQHQEARLFRVMQSYVEGLERQDIIPSPGIHCSACEFFNECRKWS